MEVPENELSVPVDYVPGARGHGVLAVGADADGSDALAVWRLGPTGHATGAWVVRLDDAGRDPSPLCRILETLRDRCLVDGDERKSTAALAAISEFLPASLPTALRRHTVAVPDLLTEIAEHRARCADAVERHREGTGSKVAPLAWPTELPAPRDLAEWTARAGSAATSPAAAAALGLTATVARVAQLWHDTEHARYRRSYLRGLGEPSPLPPQWLARLRAAADSGPLVTA
ncbi:DUF6218 family protein [Plantactinospora sp. KBS50]|uniref:DUF6218 family protein n=1 Tax=Plantactinospora sp. KBS50 TaxID=2024580 RepID=UPI000BAB0276|nr:DUF6218 family protein [Plantactinospora sp. KBS50]ASW55044.1 hypothetical protein CIK06_13925 [Plantactinospora sp. KBS50]